MNAQHKTSHEWAFISVGSNITPEDYLPLAIDRLHHLGKILAISNVYQNPPVGRPEQDDYLNTTVLLETKLSALEIRSLLRKIEADLGRVRTEDRFAARTIDLDLCLLGDTVIDTPEITLPDPDLLNRAHLAIPLAELAPNFHHPVSGETLQEIANGQKSESKLTLREDITRRLQEAVNAST